jgi:ABC-type branched-subunit amino acid transport system substrate-binding protein
MKRRRVLVAVVALGALLAASCSGDRGEDESGGPADGTVETTAPAGGGAGDFGDLVGLCGPNEGGGAVADAGPDETQGITADTITVGSVADPGFEGRPGLSQELFDAGTAFVEWCNAAGGINGKQLELNLHDAAITDYQPVMAESCRTDFGIVGSGAIQDNFWPDAGAACGLIDIAGFSLTPEKSGLAGQDTLDVRSVQPLPNPGDRYNVGAYRILAEEFPDAAARSGAIYADLESVIFQRDRIVDALEQIGHTFVYDASHNVLGEANWAPFAAAIEEAEVDFFQFVGEGDNFALLLQAMDEVGYRPEEMLLETNFYDQTFLETAGESAEGVYVRTPFWPFEEAGENPATQQYLDLVTAVDGKIAQLGAQAMSAWALFAQSARDCDLADDLTRTCVLEAAAAVEDWTGGGLHAPTTPGTNEPTECTIVLRVQGGEFVRAFPEEGYDCGEDSDEPYVVPVDV